MDNFKISGKKVMSGVVLSGMVLGRTVLSNVSFNKVFAMQEAEEKVEQNFIETDMFKFLLENITEEDILKYNTLQWDMKLDPGLYYSLDVNTLVELIALFKIAVIKFKEGNKENALVVLGCLEKIFRNPRLTKEKLWDYFRSLKSGDPNFDKNAAANVPLINACKLAYEKYKDVPSKFATEAFSFS